MSATCLNVPKPAPTNPLMQMGNRAGTGLTLTGKLFAPCSKVAVTHRHRAFTEYNQSDM